MELEARKLSLISILLRMRVVTEAEVEGVGTVDMEVRILMAERHDISEIGHGNGTAVAVVLGLERALALRCFLRFKFAWIAYDVGLGRILVDQGFGIAGSWPITRSYDVAEWSVFEVGVSSQSSKGQAGQCVPLLRTIL